MKNFKKNLLDENGKNKALKKVKRILSLFLTAAILFSIGMAISEFFDKSMDFAKATVYVVSTLLSIVMLFIVSKIDRNSPKE